MNCLDLFSQQFLSTIQQYSHIFIFGGGISGQWLTYQLRETNKLYSIIDNDIKKKGIDFDGIHVITVDQIKDIEKDILSSSLLINTISDIQETWEQGQSFSFKEQIALGCYLNDDLIYSSRTWANENDNYGSGKFTAHSLECAKYAHTAYFDKSGIFMRSLDLMVTERCSLKCTDCSNLMQYYKKPVNEDVSSLISDLNLLLSNIDHLFELRLIGGEPFVHNEIYQIIDICTNYRQISKISLYSNSTVKLDISKLKSLGAKSEKLYFSITDYGQMSRNLKENKQILDRLNIPYRSHEPEYWTDSGTIVYRNNTHDELVELFDECCGKNLLTLSESKLYRCPFAANLDRLRAIEDNSQNYLSLDAFDSASLNSYLNDISYLPACNNCKGRSYDSDQIVPAIQTRKPLEYSVLV